MIYGPRDRPQQHVTTPQERVVRLRAALKAADRFRMHRIYMGTMQHWENLLEEANRFLKEATGPDDEEARALTVQLQAIVVARQLTAGRPTRSPLQF